MRALVMDFKPADIEHEIMGDEISDEISLDFFMKCKKKSKKKNYKKDLIVNDLLLENLAIEKQEKSEYMNENDSFGNLETIQGDYTYNQLLQYIFDLKKAKNPNNLKEDKQTFTIRPPQVLRIGRKKTLFANFLQIAASLHRLPEHLLEFFLNELGTSGSLDGQQHFIIKGCYNSKQIENVLRHYIKEFVICRTCRSHDTILQKQSRLLFMECQGCSSHYSVANTKTGFQAVIKRVKK